MSFTAVILMNIGAGIALLAVLAATMRLPFRIAHPQRVIQEHRFHARARRRPAYARQPSREPAGAGRSGRRGWTGLPDEA
jgi:hypothetical protein